MVYTYPGEFSFSLVPADKYNPSGPYQLKAYRPRGTGEYVNRALSVGGRLETKAIGPGVLLRRPH